MRALVVMVLPAVLFLPTVQGNDWPQYNGPGFDRKIGGEFPVRDWEKQPPREVWTVGTSGGFSSYVTGDGRVYAIGKSGGDEQLMARDAGTGQERWSLKLGPARYDGGGDTGAEGNRGGDGPRSTPVFHKGGVFAYDAHMNVHAVRADTGKIVWKHSIPEEFGGKVIKWQNASAPIVLDDKVIVGGGGKGQAFLAFDRTSGKVVWKSGEGTITHATPTVATIHGKLQVLFFMHEGVVAVDPGNGTELWRYPFPFRVATAASPVVWDDIVSVAAGYGVGGGACRVSRSGDSWEAKEIWRVKGSGKVANIWSTPVCVDGYMYGMFSAKKWGDGPLKCVDIRTGEVKWEENGFGQGHVSVAGGKLLALTDYGELAVVDPDPGGYKELTRAMVLEGKCWSTPVFANDRLYLRSTTHGRCLRP